MPELQPEPLEEGARLFAETIAAHGGDAFLQTQTFKITGKGEFTTPPQIGGLTVPLASFTSYVTTNGRNRLEARSPGGPLLFVVRGNNKGGYVVLVGRTLQLTPEQTDGIEPIGFLRTAAQEGSSVVAVPTGSTITASDGKPLLRYDIHHSKGRITHVFIDSDTKLLRKMTSTTSRGEMTVLISAYTSVAGIPLFGELELLENGARVMKLTASGYAIDDPMKDSLFE